MGSRKKYAVIELNRLGIHLCGKDATQERRNCHEQEKGDPGGYSFHLISPPK
jgi:hypothetical protein